MATALFGIGAAARPAGPERRALFAVFWGGVVAVAGGISDFVPRAAGVRKLARLGHRFQSLASFVDASSATRRGFCQALPVRYGQQMPITSTGSSCAKTPKASMPVSGDVRIKACHWR